jgi:hypothetical protein
LWHLHLALEDKEPSATLLNIIPHLFGAAESKLRYPIFEDEIYLSVDALGEEEIYWK